MSNRSKRRSAPQPRRTAQRSTEPDRADAPPAEKTATQPLKFFPWPFLAVMASFFADLLLPRQWELTWSSDRSPAWVQPATLLLAIVSLWSLAEAVLASQLRTMALGPTAEQGRFTTRRLLESVARRGGFMTLWLTVLGAIACAESTDASVKPTSVLSDMATVGVLLGLALCVPLSLSTMWNCFGEMRRAGQITKLAQGVIAAGVVGAAMSLACLGAVGQLVRALGGSA